MKYKNEAERESGWTLGIGDGQGGLASCDSWGCKEWDTTERLNWTEHQRIGEWSNKVIKPVKQASVSF